MGLSKEELQDVVPKIIAGDDEAFQLFNKEYGQIIYLHANKWLGVIQKSSAYLYDIDDIINDLWMGVISKLSLYDAERSNMTTFLYMICNQKGERINKWFNCQSRNPGEDMSVVSIDLTYDDDYSNVITLGILPEEETENKVTLSDSIVESMHFIRFVTLSMDERLQTIYLHMIRGMTLQQTADSLGLSRERIRQLRTRIQNKLENGKKSFNKYNFEKSDIFIESLFSNQSDIAISKELSIPVGTIRICREILTQMDCYHRRKELPYDQCRVEKQSVSYTV